MRPLLVAAAAASLLFACGTGDTRALGPASSSPVAARTASPTPTFNLDDMMGFYPQQTVFVADAEKVSAVTLLNHFTRYSIPTRGKAQVAVDGSLSGPITLLYVLDGIESGPLRLRAFDLATGTERASRTDIGSVASRDRAMASAGDGRVLILKSDAGRAWVEAYERLTLEPLGTVMTKAGCGNRLLASQIRLAIVCLGTGEIAVDTLRGGGTSVLASLLPDLAGVVITEAGAIYAVTTAGRLVTAGSGETILTPMAWPADWVGTVLPDGLAIATGSATAVIAQATTDGSWLRVLALNVQSPVASVRLAVLGGPPPQFGIMALYPFAYFTSGGAVRHVEIRSGLLETMTELGPGATIAAVVDR